MSLTALNREQLLPLMDELDGWRLASINGCDCLMTSYKLSSFTQAMDLAEKISEIAEMQNHHPRLVIEWGLLEIYYWTHTSHGITELDLAAAKSVADLQK